MCTLQKRGAVYLLTLTGTTSEHRLNPPLLHSILSALSQIHTAATTTSTAAALVIAGEGKFFSNGFDLDWARLSLSDRGPLLTSLLKQTLAALISLPIPTVAAVNGHAAAAGLILALAADYVVVRSDRGFLYLSETDIGLPLEEYFIAVLRARVDRRWMREVVLRGRKVRGKEGVEMGVVDKAVEGEEETVAAAVAVGEEMARRGWNGEVYARNRMAMMAEVCKAVGVASSKM